MLAQTFDLGHLGTWESSNDSNNVLITGQWFISHHHITKGRVLANNDLFPSPLSSESESFYFSTCRNINIISFKALISLF